MSESLRVVIVTSSYLSERRRIAQNKVVCCQLRRCVHDSSASASWSLLANGIIDRVYDRKPQHGLLTWSCEKLFCFGSEETQVDSNQVAHVSRFLFFIKFSEKLASADVKRKAAA